MVIHGKDKIVLHEKCGKIRWDFKEQHFIVEQAERQSFFKTLCELTHNIRIVMFFIFVEILYNDSSQARAFCLFLSAAATNSTSYSQKHNFQHGIHCFTWVSFAINFINRYKGTNKTSFYLTCHLQWLAMVMHFMVMLPFPFLYEKRIDILSCFNNLKTHPKRNNF